MWRARSAAQAESASCTQSLFFSVSEGKSRFTVGDLRRFARRHGLPEDYASPFFESLVAGQGGSARTPEVDYATFTKQVQAREAALRRVFDALDEGALDSLRRPLRLLWRRERASQRVLSA